MIKWVFSKPLLKFSWYLCKISTYSLSYIMSFSLLGADLKLHSVLRVVVVHLPSLEDLRFYYSFYIGICIDNKTRPVLWMELEFKCTRAYFISVSQSRNFELWVCYGYCKFENKIILRMPVVVLIIWDLWSIFCFCSLDFSWMRWEMHLENSQHLRS